MRSVPTSCWWRSALPRAESIRLPMSSLTRDEDRFAGASTHRGTEVAGCVVRSPYRVSLRGEDGNGMRSEERRERLRFVRESAAVRSMVGIEGSARR